ncbi:MAG: TetR/AcrR family transcriptional regulator [Anaerolineales bacterium]|nr:TetR/AcrR family transcriptional regulator [Anaerolineales bacterium]
MVRSRNPEKKEAFLRSALKLFVASGVQNTSTAAIAQEAGTAAGTLFLYFHTKKELINELVLLIGREQSDHMKTLLNTQLSVRDTFFTIWDGSIRWLYENRDAYVYLRQVRDSGLIEQETVQESGKYFAYYYDAIQKGFDEGCVKPYPIDMIGGFLYQDIVAVMEMLIAQPKLAAQEDIIQMGFEIFWDGIKNLET